MPTRRDTFCMLLLTCLAGLAAWSWGGIIPMGDGIGTDGRIYAAMAADYFGQLERGVWSYSPDYYFQRSLPSLVVYGSLRLFGLAASSENLIFLFRAWNLAALLLSVLCYAGAARALAFTRGVTWAGYICLFWSVSQLLVPFYYPTITDTFGLLASLALLAAYFSRRSALVFLAAIVGGFVLPMLLPLGLALFLFPFRSRIELPDSTSPAPRWRAWARLAFATMGGGAFMAGMVGVALSPYGIKYGLPWVGIELGSFRGMCGIGSVGLFTGFVCWSVLGLRVVWHPIAVLRAIPWTKAALAAAAFVAVKLLVVSAVTHTSSSQAIAVVIVTSHTARYPFIFLAKHPLYFGAAILLFYARFFPFLRWLGEAGLGAMAFALPFLLVGMDPESRHFIPILPLVVLGTIATMEKEDSSWLLLAYASLLFVPLWFWQVWQGYSEVYHRYMWAFPDWLSLVAVGLVVLLYGSRVRSAGYQLHSRER